MRNFFENALTRLGQAADSFVERLVIRLVEVHAIQKKLDEQLKQDEELRLRVRREHAAARPRLPLPVTEDRFVLPWTARAAQIKFNRAAESIRDRSDIVTMQAVLDRAMAKENERPEREIPDTPRPSRKKYTYL